MPPCYASNKTKFNTFMDRYIFTFYSNKDGEGVRKKDSLGILFLTSLLNKAGYAATQVTCGWAGAKKA